MDFKSSQHSWLPGCGSVSSDTCCAALIKDMLKQGMKSKIFSSVFIVVIIVILFEFCNGDARSTKLWMFVVICDYLWHGVKILANEGTENAVACAMKDADTTHA